MKSVVHRREFDLLWIIVPVIVLSVMASSKYASLHSANMDLGLHVHALYNISNFGEYSRVLFGSFRPYLIFYALLSSFSMASPYILLSTQTFFLVIPAYFLKRRYGPMVGCAYLAYFPLWFNSLFDFHVDHLAIPLAAVFFYVLREDS